MTMQHKMTSVQHIKNRPHAGEQAATKGRGVSVRKHSWNAKARRVSGIIPIPSSGEEEWKNGSPGKLTLNHRGVKTDRKCFRAEKSNLLGFNRKELA